MLSTARRNLRRSILDSAKETPNRLTLIGDAIILASFWLTPLQLFLSAQFGGAVRQRDLFGALVWVEQGNVSTFVKFGAMTVFAGLLITPLANRSWPPFRGERIRISFFLLFASAICASIIFNISKWDYAQILRIVLFLFATGYCLRFGVTGRLLDHLTRSSAILLVMVALFIFLNPTYSTAPCREDKCSPFGSLYNSFFPHENYMAMAILLTVPFLLRLRGLWIRYFFVISALTIVLASGARVAYLAIFVLAIILILKLKRLMIWLPIIGIAASVFVFLNTFGEDLTGRGIIYSFVKESIAQNWLFGGGPNTLQNAYQGSQMNFLAFHDHGVSQSIMDKYGVPILALVCGAILHVSSRLSAFVRSPSIVLAWPFCIISLTFGSETSFDFDVMAFASWTFYLFLSVENKEMEEDGSFAPTEPSRSTV